MNLFLKYLFRFLIKLRIISMLMIVLCFILQYVKYNYSGKLIGVVGILLLIICAYLPTGRLLLYYLEHYFPQKDSIPSSVKGLILLGGFFSLLEEKTKGRPIYNQAAGRIIEFISLAKKYPMLPIIFTGTNTEVILSQKLFKEMEIDIKRVTFENKSQNTHDNSVNTYNLTKPALYDKWILVTSASHLPRSVGLFEKAGWNIIPYPVDYHTKNLTWSEYYYTIGHARNSVFWELALIEIAGLFTNFFLGHTTQLLPSKKS